MDDVLPMVNNMKAHIARVEAELVQARETIVLMSKAALSQQQEIARLKERLEAWIDWAIIVGQKGPDHDA